MKKTLIIAAAVLLTTVSGWSQGRVNFATAASGVNARATDISGGLPGTNPSGSAYKGQLYMGGPGISDDGLLIPVGVPISFQTAAQAGYLVGGNVGVTNGVNGVTFASIATSVVSVQVRAWRASDGATFEAAAGSPTGVVGRSGIIQVVLTASPTAAPNLVGLAAYNLNVVPEPSTIALGAFGLLAAWMIRRRK